jgi:hypothetical protein
MLIQERLPGHVEKTNDRDYEVEERYGRCATILLGTTDTETLCVQAVQDDGGGVLAVTKRGQGVFGLITR